MFPQNWWDVFALRSLTWWGMQVHPVGLAKLLLFYFKVVKCFNPTWRVELENFKTNLKGFFSLPLYLLILYLSTAVLQCHSVSTWGELLGTISLPRWNGPWKAFSSHCFFHHKESSWELLGATVYLETRKEVAVCSHWLLLSAQTTETSWKNSIIFLYFLTPAKICHRIDHDWAFHGLLLLSLPGNNRKPDLCLIFHSFL